MERKIEKSRLKNGTLSVKIIEKGERYWGEKSIKEKKSSQERKRNYIPNKHGCTKDCKKFDDVMKKGMKRGE